MRQNEFGFGWQLYGILYGSLQGCVFFGVWVGFGKGEDFGQQVGLGCFFFIRFVGCFVSVGIGSLVVRIV